MTTAFIMAAMSSVPAGPGVAGGWAAVLGKAQEVRCWLDTFFCILEGWLGHGTTTSIAPKLLVAVVVM